MKDVFLGMMNQWFNEFKQANLVTPPSPPPVVPPPTPLDVPNPVPVMVNRVFIDKIKKYGAEEFRGTINDDLSKAEYWILNTKRVFVELLCTPEDCLRCAVSSLKDEVYLWWDTLSMMISNDRVIWDFFHNKFKKKYDSRLFINQKEKEFLELKQGNWDIAEYEREFIQLSKYAHNIVSNEEEMCINFEDGLSDEIRMAVTALKLRELVELSERAQKVEEICKSKR
ncbi:uncharacterized protein [Gossypium hirsutum]|uniref:Retrotransposon gag domain-containing protein n=1 Tax=Gossypium hirsutum TaxID=3635 RepID=A0A1U8NFN4_GOSHI|nr:uncharacterized protein LOC107947824 [Gossypium hirsutum]